MTALTPQCCTVIALVAGLLATAPISAQQIKQGQRKQVMIRSSADGTEQPCFVIEPDMPVRNAEGEAALLIALHSWSGDYQQRNQALEQACVDEGWYYIHPNFRGQNSTPAACGSELARQDILDALAWARKQYHGDPKRIYLTGVSGGGHMTMLMAARHPEHWTACSAWVGISDLAAWHAKHKDGRYGQMMRSACGGAPGDSAEVDREYHNRSPLPFLAAAKDLPLDIAAGVHDGHTGSVPIRHSLDAFNAIAKAREDKLITEDEIQQLSRKNGKLERPLPSDQVEDATFNREIHLRRRSGPARVTIFEGGHEGIAPAAIAWLKSHVRDPQKN